MEPEELQILEIGIIIAILKVVKNYINHYKYRTNIKKFI